MRAGWAGPGPGPGPGTGLQARAMRRRSTTARRVTWRRAESVTTRCSAGELSSRRAHLYAPVQMCTGAHSRRTVHKGLVTRGGSDVRKVNASRS